MSRTLLARLLIHSVAKSKTNICNSMCRERNSDQFGLNCDMTAVLPARTLHELLYNWSLNEAHIVLI